MKVPFYLFICFQLWCGRCWRVASTVGGAFARLTWRHACLLPFYAQSHDEPFVSLHLCLASLIPSFMFSSFLAKIPYFSTLLHVHSYMVPTKSAPRIRCRVALTSEEHLKRSSIHSFLFGALCLNPYAYESCDLVHAFCVRID